MRGRRYAAEFRDYCKKYWRYTWRRDRLLWVIGEGLPTEGGIERVEARIENYEEHIDDLGEILDEIIPKLEALGCDVDLEKCSLTCPWEGARSLFRFESAPPPEVPQTGEVRYIPIAPRMGPFA